MINKPAPRAEIAGMITTHRVALHKKLTPQGECVRETLQNSVHETSVAQIVQLAAKHWLLRLRLLRRELLLRRRLLLLLLLLLCLQQR